MKKIAIFVAMAVCLIGSAGFVSADNGKATPEDVYRLVLQAHEVLSSLGEKGLAAFNDPKSEFVYKDTYVYVMQCPEYVVAHPFALDKLKGKDLRPIYPFQDTLCEGEKNPKGTWVEYMWPKPGETQPSRKIGFIIRVKGTPYAVSAGIYDDKASLEELNRMVR